MPATEFYLSNSFVFKHTGKLGVCKNCVLVVFQNFIDKYIDLEVATYHTCRLFDIYFSTEVFNVAYEQSKLKGTNPMQIYFQKVNSLNQYSGKTFVDTVDEERVMGIKAYAGSFERNNALEVSNKESEDNAYYDTKAFWGDIQSFTSDDYDYLDSKYAECINTYECDTPVMEELLKQVALESLVIRKLRAEGKDVSKNLKTLQDILGSANIKPMQETGANATEQASFGVLIKKWENEEPIPEPDPEWEDVDGIGKYIRIWFLGHLCKIMGIQNEYSKEYETEMAKLRVDLPDAVFAKEELDDG